jgi:hypothetical protein
LYWDRRSPKHPSGPQLAMSILFMSIFALISVLSLYLAHRLYRAFRKRYFIPVLRLVFTRAPARETALQIEEDSRSQYLILILFPAISFCFALRAGFLAYNADKDSGPMPIIDLNTVRATD